MGPRKAEDVKSEGKPWADLQGEYSRGNTKCHIPEAKLFLNSKKTLVAGIG